MHRIILFLVMLLGYCAALGQNQAVGSIIDSVFCEANPEQSYALYLPSYYDSAKKWPAIFIFEPAARGSLPVKKFLPGAEELGYVLVSSNNSKNGSWELSFEAGDAMFLDVLGKYNIDLQRVYTSGFSGGSRVATAIAAITGKINGVIACGAGFPTFEDYQLKENSSVNYVAVVGNQDMNYQEHRLLEQRLGELRVHNNKIIFNAGHQWPNAAYLTEALYWLELQCLKADKQVSPNFSINNSFELTKSRADSTLQSGNLLLAVNIYENLIREYSALLDTHLLDQKVKQLKQQKDFRKQLKRAERTNNNEVEYRNELREAFSELYYTRLKTGADSSLKDMNWWKRQIDFYKTLSGKKHLQTSNMGKRVINYIWATCAESSFKYISLKDYEMALILNNIWLEAQPNLWGKWNMAKILAYMDDLTFFGYLQEVVEANKALSKSTITSDKAFAHYLKHQQMQLILEQLQ